MYIVHSTSYKVHSIVLQQKYLKHHTLQPITPQYYLVRDVALNRSPRPYYYVRCALLYHKQVKTNKTGCMRGTCTMYYVHRTLVQVRCTQYIVRCTQQLYIVHRIQYILVVELPLHDRLVQVHTCMYIYIYTTYNMYVSLPVSLSSCKIRYDALIQQWRDTSSFHSSCVAETWHVCARAARACVRVPTSRRPHNSLYELYII